MGAPGDSRARMRQGRGSDGAGMRLSPEPKTQETTEASDMTKTTQSTDGKKTPAGNPAGSPAGSPSLVRMAHDWRAKGHAVGLAFVMRTWGSSPRQPGSLMIVRDDMRVEGSVSGGCVEGAVIDAAVNSMKRGTGERLEFGVSDAMAWEVGLSCGGRIEVLVSPVGDGGLDDDALGGLASDIETRKPVEIALDAKTGKRLAVDGASAGGAGGATPLGRSGVSEDGERFHFRADPPPRVIIVGGVHITQFLAPMAQQSGFDVIVIDPRQLFADADRFVGVTLMSDWPDEAMARIAPDAHSAVVTLTHDPKIDDPGLVAALNSDAFYIGCLGSRRTHAARLERLGAAGFKKAQLDRLDGPAGLDIGARTPAEIAVSVLAQIIASHRAPRAGAMAGARG